MAQATFSGQYGHNLTLDVQTGTVSQNIANNQSRVRVWATLITNQYAYPYGITAPLTVHINGGGAIHQVAINTKTSSRHLIWSQEYDITHNPDGSKSFEVSVTLDINAVGYGSATVRQTVNLATIPRASSASAGTGTIGSGLAINIQRASSEFRHTLRYKWFGKSGTIATNVETSTNWTIPLDFANNIPNSTSGTGIIYVDTYKGGSKIGEKSVSFTANVPASMKPSLSSISVTDTNTAVAHQLGQSVFLQILSNPKVTFSGARGAGGSTITGYRAEIVGKKQSTNANGGVLGIMKDSGTITIRASVIDSRGRTSASVDKQVTVLPYFAPMLNFDVIRSGATAGIFTIKRTARVAPITVNGKQLNEMTLTFKVAPSGSSNFAVDNGSASGTWTTRHELIDSSANLAGTYPANKSFDVIGIVSDKFTQSEFRVTVATEKVVVSYDKYGVGVQKIRERGAVDVKGDVYVDGNILFNNKPIQQHQLTEKSGRAIVTKTSPNSITKNGMYYLSGSPDRPTGINGYLLVEVLDDNWIKQTFTRATDGLTLIRIKADGVWKPWRHVLVFSNSNPSNLINTGWNSAGYSGSHYKRSGDMLAIKYFFTGNGSNMQIGTIPSSIWTPPQDYMLVIPQWSADGAANTHIQFNVGNGTINAVGTKKDAKYLGQILIMI